MELTFLGTGAADWRFPEPGREFRRNASALIDKCLLIDPGPWVPEAARTFGLDLNRVRCCLVTHKHSDHYNSDTVALLQANGVESLLLADGETRKLGDYTVTAFGANHATAEAPVHYRITAGGSSLYYALDGAWLTYREYRGLVAAGSTDLAVLDCTIGSVPGDYRIFEHNSIEMVKLMKQTLDPYVKQFYVSHMARTLHGTQQELTAQLKDAGIIPAFDGLTVAF